MMKSTEQIHLVVLFFEGEKGSTKHPVPWLQERITAGVSYVVPSKLALPHVTIRPAFPEAAAGPTVDCFVTVLRDQVCHFHPAWGTT